MATQVKVSLNNTIPTGDSVVYSTPFSVEGYTFASLQGFADGDGIYIQIQITSREYDDGTPNWGGAYEQALISLSPPNIWSAITRDVPLCAKYARIKFFYTLGSLPADVACICVVTLQDEKGG